MEVASWNGHYSLQHRDPHLRNVKPSFSHIQAHRFSYMGEAGFPILSSKEAQKAKCNGGSYGYKVIPYFVEQRRRIHEEMQSFAAEKGTC